MKPTFKTIITAAALAGIVSVVINSTLYFVSMPRAKNIGFTTQF